MTVKCLKNKTYFRKDSSYDDDEAQKTVKEKMFKSRRPIKNWTKAWSEHEEDFEDIVLKTKF